MKDNVSRYFGVSHNMLEKKIAIVANQNPESFDESRSEEAT
jgi:hypothetical protein